MTHAKERRRGRSWEELRRRRIHLQRQWRFLKGNRRVLLVDCLPDEQEMYGSTLRGNGLEVVTECAADAAIDYALRTAPVAVVVDMSLLGGGMDFVRRLRADPATADVLLIVLSSYVYPEDRRAAEAAGADRFLTKPCLPETLAEEIIRSLNGE